MQNTRSSPLTESFMVSAPGKVIVVGEHGAVYGHPAIAAAISLRSYLSVQTLFDSERSVTLDLKDIGLYHTWNIDSLPWPASDHASPENKLYQCHGPSLDKELLASIKPLMESVSLHHPPNQQRIHRGSATAFLYLFLSLGCRQSPGFVYTLRSTIPVGAGLGSSASVCVCFSVAMLIQGNALGRTRRNLEKELECINSWAYAGELCIHGDPSGVDNTVSCLGKAVLFHKMADRPSSVTPLDNFPTLPLLLIDTKQPRTTARQVENVRKLKDANPEVIGSILDAIGSVAEETLEFLPSDATHFNDEKKREAIEKLGGLIRKNQSLLIRLNVSHPSLDRVEHLAETARIGWTKLTGAGGGGCAIVLLRLDVSDNDIRAFERDIKKEGFVKYEVVLGAPGVAVRGRTVFGNGTEKKQDIEQIDEKKFANAVDAREIEELVGLGRLETGGGWMFWEQQLNSTHGI
ncbi:mevalonate kinase [Colletotrichum phormii]|uniref:Mevalonate kinase n=1 Tax=Colletotrichum phormii TaxID=359342 RepID=A0AAI9ZFF8_9PEZI|nr:mevalonate kinase [Colletotrichum phormii]KAK1623302.1 mevalonate kinase [Colletotrichum phormii]